MAGGGPIGTSGARLTRGIAVLDAAIVGLNRWAMILALGAMSVFVFTGVVQRYLTSGTLVWAEELSRYLMIWLAFLGIGPVLRLGGHVAVDSLIAAVPEGAQRALRGLVLLLVGGSVIWLLLAGLDYVDRTWFQTTPVLGIPFAVVALAAPVGFGLTLWHLAMMARGFVLAGIFEASEDMAPDQAPTS